MNKPRTSNKQKPLNVPRVGSTHSGIISNVMPYGVFVLFGRNTGLCHFSNVPAKIDRSELHKGRKVVVRILEIRHDKKLSLSLSELVSEDHHKVIVTRDSRQYHAAVAKLRVKDLQAVQAEREKRAIAAKRAAVKQNALMVPSPRTLAEVAATGQKRPKKKIQTAKPTILNKSQNPKAKRRSVWTISAGGFETNRRKH